MSKRQSEEAKLISYIESAPLASVEIVMGIANAKLKARRADEGEARPTKPRKARKTGTKPKKTPPAAGGNTESPGS